MYDFWPFFEFFSQFLCIFVVFMRHRLSQLTALLTWAVSNPGYVVYMIYATSRVCFCIIHLIIAPKVEVVLFWILTVHFAEISIIIIIKYPPQPPSQAVSRLNESKLRWNKLKTTVKRSFKSLIEKNLVTDGNLYRVNLDFFSRLITLTV